MKTTIFLPIANYKWFLFFLLCAVSLSAVSLSAQTGTKNYIKATEYLNETADTNSAVITVQYYDGLGRPEQIVSVKATPNGKDIVTKIEYDEFGRQTRDYLPVPASQSSGNFIDDPNSIYTGYYGTGTAYNTEIFYSEKELESSPLGRVLKQAAPGDDWKLQDGHEIQFGYQTNSAADNIRMFMISLNGDFEPTLSEWGSFSPGLLYKTITTDENGHTIEEYKTKLGLIILKRTFQGTNTLDTYYVYDSFDNLTFVIPPLAAVNPVIRQDILEELCYQYKYDKRNRLIEKKLPGKGIEFMLYDKQDRLVATQDANLRPGNKWLFTKYDKFGRVVYTGLTTGSKSVIESLINSAADNNNEKRNDKAGFVKNGLEVMYMNNAFPTAIDEIYTVNYYDNYGFEQVSFPGVGGLINSNPVSAQNKVNTRGALTASMVRILGTDTWEKNYYFYDSKLRLRYSLKKNHLDGETTVENEYNFRGLVTKSTTLHKRSSNAPVITVVDEYTYSPQERLMEQTQKVNQNPKEKIAVNQYDELGRLIGKSVGGQSGQPSLQQVDYRYNIRGWLTDINDTGQLQKTGQPVDLFAFKINYNEPVAGYFQSSGADVQPLFNGNIAETYWRTASDNILRGYGYDYDELNRLENAYYQKPNSITPLPQTFDEYLSYDLNGNITSLKRYSGDDSPTGTFPADDLEYTYFTDSNRLKRVSDSTNSNFGFDDGNTNPALDDYEYDLNGNMVKDRNKGITNIVYNHLNLPIEIQWSSTKKIEYLYNAAGGKVQKKVTNGASIRTTDYLDGFQYNENFLEFFPHSEGYVKATNLSLGGNPNYVFNYVYNYTDHLGNVRLSYAKDPQTGNLKILDESHYYPFGLKHQEYQANGFTTNPIQGVIIAPVANNPFKYAFNNKELQDELNLNLYDYGARNYDPALGRFFNLDRLTEKYEAISPYGYVANNPVRFIDINGEWIYIWDNEGEERKKYRYENGKTQQQVDGKWVTIDETVELSDYVVNIVAGLNELERSGNTGFSVVNFFSNDENNVFFGGTGNVNKFYSSNRIEVNKKFKGGIVPVEGNKAYRSPFYIALGHELAHRIDYSINGKGTRPPWFKLPNGQIVSSSEKFATHIENMIRSESGLPLRTHYVVDTSSSSNGYGPSKIIDSDGNSLFYNQPVPTNLYNFKEGVIIQMRKQNVKYNYRLLNPNSLNNSYK